MWKGISKLFLRYSEVFQCIDRAMSSKTTNSTTKPWRILSHKGFSGNTLIWVVYCHVKGRLYCHGKDLWRKWEDKKVNAHNLDWYIKCSILPLPSMQWILPQKNLLYLPGQVDEMTGPNPKIGMFTVHICLFYFHFLSDASCEIGNP